MLPVVYLCNKDNTIYKGESPKIKIMLGTAEKCSTQMKKAKLGWEQVEETGEEMERKPTGLARYHYLVPSNHSLYSYLLFYCCIAQHEKEAILDKDEVEVEGDKD